MAIKAAGNIPFGDTLRHFEIFRYRASYFHCILRESTRWALCQGGLLSPGQQILDEDVIHAPQVVLD